nr:6644_t:CDS:2 [Entrophospora candida]
MLLDNSNDPLQNITIKKEFNESDVNDNYFVSFLKSVEAVYFWPAGRWDQIDNWNFWPVDVLTTCEGVFEDANNNVKQKTLKVKADLLYDYETLEKPFGNTRGNPHFIYYVGRVDYLEKWLLKAENKFNALLIVDKK